MPIWKIAEGKPVPVAETTLSEEHLLEEHLEDWIEADQALLDEHLWIIGRQVMIPDVRDRLDLLALDAQGNAVIIELKRGELTDPVDMQALRYASYISRWRFEDFENQARTYLGKAADPEFNFNERYEQFCQEAGVDDVPDLNVDQRVIVVGAQVRARLASVALWLRQHNIDIKLIEVRVYREGKALLLQPQSIVPMPASLVGRIGGGIADGGAKPWRQDGKSWHLDKRCSPLTREMLLALDDLIRDNLEVDGPRWNQQAYVAYRVGNHNWLSVETTVSALKLIFVVKSGAFDQAALAARLGVEEFRVEGSLSEKLGLPSSVQVWRRNEDTDGVLLRIKEGFDVQGEVFLAFLKEAYAAFE